MTGNSISGEAFPKLQFLGKAPVVPFMKPWIKFGITDIFACPLYGRGSILGMIKYIGPIPDFMVF
jgi:hypothetical protein